MKLTPWSSQNVVEKAQLAAPVYMLSIFQLGTLLAEHAGKERCVLVVSFPQIDSYGRRDPPSSHSQKSRGWFYHTLQHSIFRSS